VPLPQDGAEESRNRPRRGLGYRARNRALRPRLFLSAADGSHAMAFGRILGFFFRGHVFYIIATEQLANRGLEACCRAMRRCRHQFGIFWLIFRVSQRPSSAGRRRRQLPSRVTAAGISPISQCASAWRGFHVVEPVEVAYEWGGYWTSP